MQSFYPQGFFQGSFWIDLPPFSTYLHFFLKPMSWSISCNFFFSSPPGVAGMNITPSGVLSSLVFNFFPFLGLGFSWSSLPAGSVFLLVLNHVLLPSTFLHLLATLEDLPLLFLWVFLGAASSAARASSASSSACATCGAESPLLSPRLDLDTR